MKINTPVVRTIFEEKNDTTIFIPVFNDAMRT